MNIQIALKRLVEKKDLTSDEMTAVMEQIMSGQASSAQIAGFLIALRMKGETVNEIIAAANVMRALAIPVFPQASPLLDIVGTGGDHANTFNISTTCAFVIAAAGVNVAKHGNRAISSQSGSADVLQIAGARLDLSAQDIAHCIDQTGIGFMFAPQHHTATHHAVEPRKALGVRTLFNLLGPLTNPAHATRHLIGVYQHELLITFAKALRDLGSERALIVHSRDGLDEISIAADTQVVELNRGKITSSLISPEEFGIAYQPLTGITVNSSLESLHCMQSVLGREPGPARDIVLLNAGAGLYCAGVSTSIQEGVEQARQLIDQGLAAEKLQTFIHFTQQPHD